MAWTKRALVAVVLVHALFVIGIVAFRQSLAQEPPQALDPAEVVDKLEPPVTQLPQAVSVPSLEALPAATPAPPAQAVPSPPMPTPSEPAQTIPMPDVSSVSVPLDPRLSDMVMDELKKFEAAEGLPPSGFGLPPSLQLEEPIKDPESTKRSIELAQARTKSLSLLCRTADALLVEAAELQHSGRTAEAKRCLKAARAIHRQISELSTPEQGWGQN